MFSDIVEIVAFIVKQIISKEIKTNKNEVADALYGSLKRLQIGMTDLISVLSKDEACFSKGLWETPKERWISQVNKKLSSYECDKEMIFYTLEEYDDFTINGKTIFATLVQKLRDRLDDPNADYIYIDTRLMIHGCYFDFIDKVIINEDCKNHKELFIPISLDISRDDKKLKVIGSAKEDLNKIENLKKLLQERHGLVDLSRRKTLILDWE